MSSSELASRLRASVRQQPRAVAGLVLLAAFYAAFLGGMKWRSRSLAEQFYEQQETVRAKRVLEFRSALAEAPGASLPLEWEIQQVNRLPHTRVLGLSVPESWGVWTDARVASLVTRLAPAPAEDLELTVTAHAAVLEPHRRQRVHLRVNGTRVASWQFNFEDDERHLVARIPRELLSPDGMLELVFDLPDALSPFAVFGYGEGRSIALGLRRMQLVRAAPENEGRP